MRTALGILILAVAPLTAQVQVVNRPSGASGPLMPSQPRPVETGTSSIEGAVLDSITHNPIPKAIVNLNGRTSLTAVTDSTGHFAFRQLPPAQYFVQAQSDNYPIGPFSLDLGRQAVVSVAADEHKTGVALTLIPGASLRGRIVDEEGNPMPQCTVSPMRYRNGDSNASMVGAAQVQSNEKGEYRIGNVPAGKYYLLARCFLSIPMPHAFVRREALSGVTMLTYSPLFYPSSTDLSGATRVSLAAGTDLSGIDFQMTPATGINLRGHVRPVVSGGFMQITLVPKNKLLRSAQQQGARANPTTGEFQIPMVRQGSYDLVATAQAEGHSYFARVPVEVGATTPEPIDVVMDPAPQISGSITIEGDTKVPFKNVRITLFPVDAQPAGPPPQTEVQSDGTFVISASPGQWRLQVSSGLGYLKSVTLGDQEVSPSSLDIGSAPGALKIVMGTKNTQVDASVAGLPSDAQQISGLIWSATGAAAQQNFPVNSSGSGTINLPPGRYFACAIAGVQPFMLLGNPDFRKALERPCPPVDVPADSRTSIQVPFIGADEIKRLAESLEADETPAN